MNNCVHDLKGLLDEGRIKLTKISKRHITTSMKKFNPQASCTDSEVYIIAAEFQKNMKPLLYDKFSFCPNIATLVAMFPKFAIGGELNKGIESELNNLLNFYNELVIAMAIFSPTLDLIIGMLTYSLEGRFRAYINGSGATLPTRRRIELFRSFVPMKEKRPSIEQGLSITTDSYSVSPNITPYPSPDQYPIRMSQMNPYDEDDDEVDVRLELDYHYDQSSNEQYDQALISQQNDFVDPFKTVIMQQQSQPVMMMPEFAIQYCQYGTPVENDLKAQDNKQHSYLVSSPYQVTQCEPVVHVETEGDVRTTRLTFTFTTNLAEQPQIEMQQQQQFGNQGYYYGGTYPTGGPSQQQPQQMYPQVQMCGNQYYPQQGQYQQICYQQQQQQQLIHDEIEIMMLDSLLEGFHY